MNSAITHKRTTRRRFLGTSIGAAAGPSIVPAAALGRGAASPANRVTVGIIGSGGRALFEARQYPSFDNTEIVAVCDAQESRRMNLKAELEKSYAQARPGSSRRGIRTYLDFRELLAQKDIDAVYIVTPDHWHVTMTIAAMEAGKHCHTEKPLGVSIEQDLAVLRAVRKHKKLFQYGAERRSSPDARKGIELVLNGRIGKVQELYVVGPPSATGGSATPEIPVPPGFDYDLWLGPAPVKPFSHDRCQGQGMRNAIYQVADYTLGQISNWGAHPLDQVQWWADNAGRTTPPVRYEGSGKFPAEGLFDTSIRWDVRCTWEDGLVLRYIDHTSYHNLKDVPHPAVSWSATEPTKMHNGAVFVGTEGWVIVSYDRVLTQPASLMDSTIGPREIHLHDSALAMIPPGMPKGMQQVYTGGHHQDWVRAILRGGQTVDGIESAVRSDLVSQLVELCIRTGQSLRWYPAKQTILGNEAARKMISRPMRKPWGIA
jgi:hypothetical protein